jgi:signal transduction histidine kinase
MISREETDRSMPPFFQRIAPVKAYYLSIQAAAYGLALASYPSVARGLSIRPYFEATYYGCVAASVALSALALFLRPGLRLGLVLFLRLYVLVILGYSIGGFLSAKLALGVGLMVEIGILLRPPLGPLAAGAALAVLGAAQAWPVFFGPSGLVEATPLPEPAELAALCFALAAAAASASWIGAEAERQKERAELARMQEANLDSLAELNLNLQGYARTVDEESAERERNRISREIHDISGYIFTNLIALMDAAGSMPRDDQAGLTDILVTARTQAQEGLRETRAALRKLRGQHSELVDATRSIHKIVSIFRKITGIEVELNLGNLPHFLAQDLNLALYRTVQEALTNSVRHGKASRVRVNFWVDAGFISLAITDNGKGAFEVVKGIGLAGMDERIGALGGTVDVGRAAEGGFALSVRVPLRVVPYPGSQG